MFSAVKETIAAWKALFAPKPQTDEEIVTRCVVNDTCPDCGSTGFLEGPAGGISQNIMCANAECGSRFNYTGPLGLVERISIPSPHAESAHAKAQLVAQRQRILGR